MIYRYFIKLAYNGSSFCGWQIQPNAISVQEVLEKNLSLLIKSGTATLGCGRTDTGVHAKEFFAHFDCPKPFETDELAQLTYQLNKILPPQIAIRQIVPVSVGAHARFSATARTYEYYILQKKDPFLFSNALYYNLPLDIKKMNEACRILLNATNFECFSKVNTDVINFNCRLMRCQWEQQGDLLVFTVQADRFLRNMVRAMVGTLMDIGRGKTELINLEAILKSQNRCKAGASVFAGGLFLSKVDYPNEIWAESPMEFLKADRNEIIRGA